ncbi:pyridoxamine 5'-phosphate oxidase [Prolixibacteraceae bacterium Z1-6]|uniref:Pyridoxine/pyridoxamine 5'-phosphate oxidase n=1 Tax=Draconibacterium aestuarii TaxID=2998507 RepID=A0A9X3J623_9BACT|nr:pyridoxamine 5'-phosphate oxidase [Prolixibacteraceae bacterium Z1-6]
MKLKDIRRDYSQAKLNEHNISPNPVQQFQDWMNQALEANIRDATAMSLVTVGKDGFPQSRIVLLKDFEQEGFTFFTNYRSEKGMAIEANPKISLHFFWPELERQIRISGIACKTSLVISKKYFHSRPQKSQIAASISEQSSVVQSREFLENKFAEYAEELNGKNPDYPENWGGYLVEPVKFEFWQGRENRLHDRIVYEKTDDEWKIKRLAP